MSVHPEHSGSGCAHAKALSNRSTYRSRHGTPSEPAKQYRRTGVLYATFELAAREICSRSCSRTVTSKAGLAAGFSRRSVSCLGAQLVRYHRVTERMSELRKSRQKAAQHSDRIKAQLNVPNEIESTPLFNADGVAIGIFVPLPTADQKAR